MAPDPGSVQDHAAVDREPGGDRPRTTRSVAETSAARTSGTTGKPVFSPFTELRRLFAYYWRPLLTLIALVPSLLTILNTLGLSVSKWPERADSVTQRVLIGLGIVVLVVIRFPKVAYVITKLIVPPPPLPPDRPHVFRGLLQTTKRTPRSSTGAPPTATPAGTASAASRSSSLKGSRAAASRRC